MSNSDIVRSIIEVWNHRDLSTIDRFVHPNHVSHGPTDDQFPQGIEGQRVFVRTFLAAFPDVEAEITDISEEGDLVDAYVTYRGTHQGELMGIPATGRRVTVHVHTRDRIANGKIVESWAEWDPNDMMRQLGVG